MAGLQGSFVVDGLSELEECQYKEESGTAILDYSFEADNNYNIFITGRKK